MPLVRAPTETASTAPNGVDRYCREQSHGHPAEVREELPRRTGVEVHERTLAALHDARWGRSEDGSAVVEERAAPGKKHYGYTEAHRRMEPAQIYPCWLPDAERALVQDLSDNTGGRGTPPADRCLLLCGSYRMLVAHAADGRAARRTAAALATRSLPRSDESDHDAGKKVKGRKRHLVFDTLGPMLAVSVTATSVQDRDGAHTVVPQTMSKYLRTETLFVASGYAGRCFATV